MMVYRISVLSFTHSAFISDRWLAFPFSITENSFPRHADFFPPVWWKHYRYETEQEADFFLGSSVDKSQMWPLRDKVHVSQGRERRIKNRAERKRVRLVSATSHSLIRVLPSLHARFPSARWTRQRQICLNALSSSVAGDELIGADKRREAALCSRTCEHIFLDKCFPLQPYDEAVA